MNAPRRTTDNTPHLLRLAADPAALAAPTMTAAVPSALVSLARLLGRQAAGEAVRGAPNLPTQD